MKGLQLSLPSLPAQNGFAALVERYERLRATRREALSRYTPCTFDNPDELLEALAITHCELVLIHPFREGNGRVSRLLSTLMALQAGLPLLNFSGIKGKRREAYFAAVRAGMGRNYAPMVEIFRKVVAASS